MTYAAIGRIAPAVSLALAHRDTRISPDEITTLARANLAAVN